MNAIISPLDDEHNRRVSDLWAELEAEFGLRGVLVTPYPHFTFQLAASYDLTRLETTLHDLAATIPPVEVQTRGLGIFTGEEPVLFVRVIRTPELNTIHQRIWDACAALGTGLSDYYAEKRWIPHITLAAHDLTPATLRAVTAHLHTRDFNWRVPITHLAFIHHPPGQSQVMKYQTPLG